MERYVFTRFQIISFANGFTPTISSIPRPEVVKRIRPDPKAADANKSSVDAISTLKSDSMQVDRKISPLPPSRSRDEHPADTSVRYPLRDPQNLPQQTTSSVHEYPDQSRSFRPTEQTQGRLLDNGSVMPPPAVPSQTASAQELRETARQTIGRLERPESRGPTGPSAPSPRIRSPSPSSRPGTRNGSNESRTSGGKSRSDHGNTDRGSDDRRSEREGRPEARETMGTLSRRDSLTHNRTERSTRERGRDEKDREGDRDKDRGRDRHGDREKDRDRERDRDRDRERDRERDRDRDRHRRDDKDRDRDTRKERDTAVAARAQVPPAAAPPSDDRALPSRPDPSRHRNTPQTTDENLGKRRRPTDDDVSSIPTTPAQRLMDAFQPDRGSKRSSRKEGHREDRSRRPPEKEERNRDSDRRRKDRDGDIEGRGSSSEKVILIWCIDLKISLIYIFRPATKGHPRHPRCPPAHPQHQEPWDPLEESHLDPKVNLSVVDAIVIVIADHLPINFYLQMPTVALPISKKSVRVVAFALA